MSVKRLVARALALSALAIPLLAGAPVPAPAHAGVVNQFAFPFTGVGVSVSGVSASVHTWFEGNGPVTLTVGATQQVGLTTVKKVTTSTHFASSWTLSTTGLKPNKTYFFTLTAPDAVSYIGSFKTQVRDIKVSFKRIEVIKDGDGWPKGCGEFVFTFDVDYWEKYTSQMCLDDGANIAVPNNHLGYEPGNFTLKDYRTDYVHMAFWAHEDDHCWCLAEPDYCDGYYSFTDVRCADLAYQNFGETVTKAGTNHRYIHVNAMGVDVKTDYYITVSYHW